MADFQSQAMGLTGLTIDASSTTPSRAEFSTFLNDGVIDVTNRWLLVRPQDIDKFTRESSTTASNGFDTTGAQIVAVIREAGADGDTDGSTAWEPCSKVPVQMQSRVVDVNSLSYASKYNPVYIIDSNGLLNVYPVPDGTDDGYKVFYVNSSPEETDGSALDHASTGIKWFPDDKVYLVVLYASMRSIQAKMGDTTITDLSLSPVPPNPPTITTVSFTDATAGTVAGVSLSYSNTAVGGTAPAYNSGSVVGFGSLLKTLANLSISAVPPDTPSLSTITYSSLDSAINSTLVQAAASTTLTGAAASANVPTYTKPTATGGAGLTGMEAGVIADVTDQIEFDTWWDTLGDLIETQEDTELAGAQMQKISTYISAYQAEMQNELNEFNKENIKFQASFQESMAEFQSANQMAIADAERSQNRQLQTTINDMKVIFDNNAQAIQKYGADLQSYQADVNSQVQEYQISTSAALQQHSQSMQDHLNLFNDANVEYQANLQHTLARIQSENNVNIQEAQIELQDKMKDADLATQVSMQAAISDMQAIVAKNQANTAEYTAEVQAYQAEVAAAVQEYTQNLQADGVGYQWLQDQYARLKAEYDQAFMLAAPKQQEGAGA